MTENAVTWCWQWDLGGFCPFTVCNCFKNKNMYYFYFSGEETSKKAPFHAGDKLKV